MNAIHILTEKNRDLSKVPNPNRDETITAPTIEYTIIIITIFNT